MHFVIEALGAAGAAGLASAPHCAAMCGPLAVAACAGPSGVSGRATMGYLSGRLGAYALTGAVAGAAGGAVSSWLGGERARSVVAVVVGASLALSAWRLYRGGARPRETLVTLGRKPASALRGLGFGVLTGLLPCGALAAGWMLAASAGSVWLGALVMAVFSLASAPGLGAALWVGRMIPRGVGARARALGAAALLLAGVWVAARPWTMPVQKCHCHGAAVAMRAP